MSMVKIRQEVEQKIIRAAVDSLLAGGFRLSVSLERGFDLDDCLLGSRDVEKIIAEATAGDDCFIFVHRPDGLVVEDGSMNDIAWMYFVFGNDGWDVLSNYSVTDGVEKDVLDLEPYLVEAKKISDHYAD